MFDFDENYMREAAEAYFAEEAEMKAGIHPTQVKERMMKELNNLGYDFDDTDIGYLNWEIDGPRVEVFTDEGDRFGIFNYEDKIFESTPESRLEEATKDFELNRRDWL